MRIVTISPELLEKYKGDPEVLIKSGRPCVLVIRLKYKGQKHDFAVPLRSNIPAAAPKDQYFALPPRPSTRPGNRHGIHYIKMFPVTKKYQIRYRTEGNGFAQLIQSIIDKNTKKRRLLTPARHIWTGMHPGRDSCTLQILIIC